MPPRASFPSNAFAQGLKIAASILKEGLLKDFVKPRYASWDPDIESGKAKFETLEQDMLQKGNSTPNTSGPQEMLENIINRSIR